MALINGGRQGISLARRLHRAVGGFYVNFSVGQWLACLGEKRSRSRPERGVGNTG